MRTPIIAGNWKLHKTCDEALELANALKAGVADATDVEVVVAPVFTALTTVAEALAGSHIRLAAQNCYPEDSGAFTGEVSPALLKDVGCSYVIIGHSERRQLFGEADDFINRKAHAVTRAGMGAILCIGELLEEREADRVYDVLRKQIRLGLKGLDQAAMASVVIAYEPVWAIGTGKTATAEQAQEVHAFVRALVKELYNADIAAHIRILYGGSVKPDNIDSLMAQPDVDGALVGGASLKAADFSGIVAFKKP